MAKSKLSGLNQDQAARLVEYARDHGQDWKYQLATEWASGTDTHHVGGNLLRQIRNQAGPRWLAALPQSEVDTWASANH